MAEGEPVGLPVRDTCLIPGAGPAQRPWLGLPQLYRPHGCNLCTVKGLLHTSATCPPATRASQLYGPVTHFSLGFSGRRWPHSILCSICLFTRHLPPATRAQHPRPGPRLPKATPDQAAQVCSSATPGCLRGLERCRAAGQARAPPHAERCLRREVTGVLPPLLVRAPRNTEIHRPVRNLEERWVSMGSPRRQPPPRSPELTQVHCRDGGFVPALVHSCSPEASLHMYRSVGRPLWWTTGVLG